MKTLEELFDEISDRSVPLIEDGHIDCAMIAKDLFVKAVEERIKEEVKEAIENVSIYLSQGNLRP